MRRGGASSAEANGRSEQESSMQRFQRVIYHSSGFQIGKPGGSQRSGGHPKGERAHSSRARFVKATAEAGDLPHHVTAICFLCRSVALEFLTVTRISFFFRRHAN